MYDGQKQEIALLKTYRQVLYQFFYFKFTNLHEFSLKSVLRSPMYRSYVQPPMSTSIYYFPRSGFCTLNAVLKTVNNKYLKRYRLLCDT